MTWKGNDPAKEFRTVEDLKAYITSLDYRSWRPSNFTVHNTASPTLYQWWHSVPPAQRMENLQHYYEYDMGWSSGPHFFIDGVSWWCMCPPNVKGVHSPSWNGSMLGFEHVGDYETESATSGMGADVQRMGHQLSAVCCEFFGWDPANLKFHYEDPATDHACPGSNMEKSTYIESVREAMGDGGDDQDRPERARRGVVSGLVAGDSLNIRASSSSSSPIIGTADNGDEVRIVGSAMNGTTEWLRIQIGRSAGPDVAVYGWVSADYVRQGPELPGRPPSEGEIQDNHKDITTTVFGGAADGEYSAYPPYDSNGNGMYLNDTDLYVSLPVSISNYDADNPPKVRVFKGELSGVGVVRDKGPWVINDTGYVYGTDRPIAETCYQEGAPLPGGSGNNAGKVPTNPAGLDISPALAEMIGLDGKGQCDWMFEE